MSDPFPYYATIMKKFHLHWQILIALVLGFIFGFYLPDFTRHVEWMGTLFLRALRMIIVPLIFSSIVLGVAGIGSGKNLGRLGLKTISYYLFTSLFAILTGLTLVNIIKPGIGADLGLMETIEGLPVVNQTFGQTLLNIIPVNIIDSLARGDFLAIIFFAIIFGFFATQVAPSQKETVVNISSAVFEVMMKITLFVIKFTPLGVFGIVAGLVADQAENLAGVLGSLGVYMLTVFLGLAFHGLVTLPLIIKFLGRSNPLKHAKGMSVPLLTAFSTASSSATLPLTMQAVENNSGVSKSTSSFVLPLGATINMDGTALYHCVSALFIAQAYGIELTMIQQFMIVITALLASIGAAGIPMAGLVIITLILSAVGLPLEGVGLLLAVDRILDPLRTTVNVWSDTCGTVVIAKSEGENLKV
jgi:Na+/H+-dicarboxylate symporter